MRLGNLGQVRSNLLSGIAMTSGVDAWHPPICSVSSLYSVVLQYMHILWDTVLWIQIRISKMGAFSLQRKVATNEIHQNIVFSATARASHWPLALHLLDTLEADVIGVSSAMEAFGCASRWQMAVELLFAWNLTCKQIWSVGPSKGNFKNRLVLCSCAVIRSTVQVRKDIKNSGQGFPFRKRMRGAGGIWYQPILGTLVRERDVRIQTLDDIGHSHPLLR